jgi:hypothetical protein
MFLFHVGKKSLVEQIWNDVVGGQDSNAVTNASPGGGDLSLLYCLVKVFIWDGGFSH